MFVLNLKSKTNKSLLINIFSSYLVKGLGVLCSLISMPLFLKYFNDQMILGVWFTMLSVLNWILVFDMGIGNGLRNHLTKALAKKDFQSAKQLVSSSYVMDAAKLAITSIIEGPSLRHNCRKFAESTFDKSNLINDYISVYRELIK